MHLRTMRLLTLLLVSSAKISQGVRQSQPAAVGLEEHSSPAEEYATRRNHSEPCRPRLLRSACPDAEFRGLVLFFPGFSACPSQVDDLAPLLTGACLDVFAPLIPGHDAGLPNCSAGEFCSVKFNDDLGHDLRELPTNSSVYLDFVHEVSNVAHSELSFRAEGLNLQLETLEFGVIGLSLGGSMASYAASSYPERFTRQLQVNPFFGMGQEGVDANLKHCLQKVAEGNATKTDCMVKMFEDWIGDTVSMPASVTWILRQIFGTVAGVQRPILSTMAKFSDAPPGNRSSSIQEPIRKFMDKEQEWGDVCWKITDHARGGFCKFRQEHLFAAHSFGMHALVQAQQLTAQFSQLPVLQVVMTERDGITRNGLSYAAARRHYELARQLRKKRESRPWSSLWRAARTSYVAVAQKKRGSGYRNTSASACMYRFFNVTNREDPGQWGLDHVMPHANLASVDNPGADMWWEEKLFKNIVGFLSGERDRLSDLKVTGAKNECVDVSLRKDALKSKATSWLKTVLSPEAAPKYKSELTPNMFWNATVLNFDYWARHVGCPYFSSSLKGVVNCSLFA